MALEKGSIRDYRSKLNLAAVRRVLAQIGYYSDAYRSDLTSPHWQAEQLRKLFDALDPEGLDPSIRQRVNYYNKLGGPVTLEGDIALGHLPRDRSRYFHDIMSVTKPFGLESRIAYLYGDIKHVPDTPTIVKSRPIAGDNANSVLLNLNRFRHFRRADDPFSFEEKSPTAVWRGRLCNKMRIRLAEKFEHHPDHDIGYAVKGTRIGIDNRGVAPKRFLSIEEQCRHRYILSLEGNDVATSLKWIMSSNSLCLSPALHYETWFMEGTLKPGVHFAEVRDDFEDLEDKISYYEAHPDEAKEIIANAQAYWQNFLDAKRERLVSLLVVQKYLERTGQRKPEAFSDALFD
jgi:Glycosyl transferase family 90